MDDSLYNSSLSSVPMNFNFSRSEFLVKQIARGIENSLFLDYDVQILVQETMDAYPNSDEVSLDLDTLTA